MQREHQRILSDLLSLPTAPFAEHYVIDYVREFCRRRPALRLTQDRSGNLLIRYGPRKRRPIVLAAHMDHPGFIVQSSLPPSRPLRMEARVPLLPGDSRTGRHLVLAKWYGGVRPEYFAGARVRFFDGAKWVRGHVVRVECGPDGKAPRVSHVEAALAEPVPPGAVGMWDFADPTIRAGRLYARGCDDVAGVAATLACLDDLVRRHNRTRSASECHGTRSASERHGTRSASERHGTRSASERHGTRSASERHPKPSLHVLLTRAEEVGFVGAIAACRNRTIPADAVVVSIECSAELPGARMGDGPILRVGDLATTFSPVATGWCRAVAERLAAAEPPFPFQRKLMDGGTCEATVYGEFGYAASGLCIALGNYHNMDRTRKRLAPECIDLGDWEGLVRWFVALATTDLPCDSAAAALRERLRKLERSYRQDLEAGLGARQCSRGESNRDGVT